MGKYLPLFLRDLKIRDLLSVGRMQSFECWTWCDMKERHCLSVSLCRLKWRALCVLALLFPTFVFIFYLVCFRLLRLWRSPCSPNEYGHCTLTLFDPLFSNLVIRIHYRLATHCMISSVNWCVHHNCADIQYLLY